MAILYLICLIEVKRPTHIKSKQNQKTQIYGQESITLKVFQKYCLWRNTVDHV